MKRLLLVCTLAGLLGPAALAMGQEKQEKKDDAAQKPSQEELEKAFAEKMTGAVLVGTFTVRGKTDGNPPKTERYTVSKATRVPGTDAKWVFAARIQYGDKDYTVPVPVDVFWAGDTPVISLTDLTIPGYGTFTSRVMIYGDQYAGTWQHGDAGGHMWGRIEREAK